jgi:CheY-like chemotaxis protein
LADDDPDDRELMAGAFQEVDSNIELLMASSGKEALELLLRPENRLRISLIMLDFNMPDLSGAEVFEKIRDIPEYARIPKVIWSTSDSPLYQKISRESSATHYFEKPLVYQEILPFAKKIFALGG